MQMQIVKKKKKNTSNKYFIYAAVRAGNLKD